MSIATIIYTYIGFPVLTIFRAAIKRHPIKRQSSELPYVSVIIAAHNEAAVITEKLDNTLSLDYPSDCLEVIVASDGSNDSTNELVQNFHPDQVTLLILPRQGKNSALNTAVATSRGEILLFTDTDTFLAPDAINNLVKPFADKSVGGVTGEHQFSAQVKSGLKWQFKRGMKTMMSGAGSATAGEGQIYAIRRELFRTLPKTVTDDLYNSLQVPAAHQRLVFEPEAIAYPIANNKTRQSVFQRKVRINTRVLQTLWIMRRLFNPFEYGFFPVQLVSHKLMRRLAIIPLILLGVSAVGLRRNGRFYNIMAISLLGLYSTALIGAVPLNTRIKRAKLVRKPYNYFRNGIAFLVALTKFFSGKRYEMWTHENETTYRQ